MTTLEFYDNLKSQVPALHKDSRVKDVKIGLAETQIEMLRELFIKWIKSDNKNKFAISLLNDFLKKPNNSNGKVYEALIYSWLNDTCIEYEPQCHVNSEDCFKKNSKGYYADGRIFENNIIFDVKQFGFTISLYGILKNKIQNNSIFPKNCMLTISGNKSAQTIDTLKTSIEHSDELTQHILEPNNKIFQDYLCTESKLEFRVWKLNPNRIITSYSELDPYQWAENNEFYFMRHSSQFCLNSPYIIFCPFDQTLLPMFFSDKNFWHLAFRSLCRRIFIHLPKLSDRKIIEFDGKAKSGISVSVASKKISAIVFMDVSKKSEYNNSGIFVYVNPNSDNKIKNYMIHSLFRNAGAKIDDFKYDNY